MFHREWNIVTSIVWPNSSIYSFGDVFIATGCVEIFKCLFFFVESKLDSVPYHFNDTCRLPPREASKEEALVILVLLTVDCSNTFENKKQTFVTKAHQLTLNDLRQHTRQTATRAVFRSNTTIKLFVFGSEIWSSCSWVACFTRLAARTCEIVCCTERNDALTSIGLAEIKTYISFDFPSLGEGKEANERS